MINVIKTNDRLCLIRVNNYGTEMKIIKILSNDKVLIRFNDDFKFEKEIHYNNFKSGNVRNPYEKSIYGIGYVGLGRYNVRTSSTQLDKKYNVWNSMLDRCYSDNTKRYPAYVGCTVCDDWLCYQNFAQWYENNYYQVDTERMHIDKDILVKGNKLYSPDTCIIIPQRINMIFMNKGKTRDLDLPVAIYRCVTGYQATYGGKSLGVFKTLEEAIATHDNKMKIHIKNVADEYQNKLPTYIYKALLKWT